jgi:DNA-binding Xre family transcriptional regulator
MDIKQQLKERKMLKRELADEMGITMPTLKKKLDEPRHLTVGDIERLRQLGFIINV